MDPKHLFFLPFFLFSVKPELDMSRNKSNFFDNSLGTHLELTALKLS